MCSPFGSYISTHDRFEISVYVLVQVKVHLAHLVQQAHQDYQENEELLEHPVLRVLEEPQVHQVRRETLEQ